MKYGLLLKVFYLSFQNIAHLETTFQKVDSRIWAETITFKRNKWELCVM